ncbi:Uncharacterised protein [Legionella donaldsonii]|uniref:Uncharacterized protein n=1 Tax=Legionella donaldsonii TaxID=45060 RepID=A0A378KMY3_9GAMM|nr:hypothetical protein [Legionella donaldsonii]STX84925.1 Uncharacterised protein [Legionella donaldsonii]
MNIIKQLLFILLLLPIPSFALTYTCNTFKKVNFEQEYPKDQLEKFQSFTLLETYDDNVAYVSRCVYFDKKIQCKKMLVDRIERDTNGNSTKFYVFASHFNFQLFHNLSGLEDNGGGDISFQKCTVE